MTTNSWRFLRLRKSVVPGKGPFHLSHGSKNTTHFYAFATINAFLFVNNRSPVVSLDNGAHRTPPHYRTGMILRTVLFFDLDHCCSSLASRLLQSQSALISQKKSRETDIRCQTKRNRGKIWEDALNPCSALVFCHLLWGENNDVVAASAFTT